MSKSKELHTTTDIVKDVLTTFIPARNSDSVLIVKVYERINAKAVGLPLCVVMADLKSYGLPSPETIRRTRQKLQATYPELAGDSSVEAQRMMNEEVFRDYARGMV